MGRVKGGDEEGKKLREASWIEGESKFRKKKKKKRRRKKKRRIETKREKQEKQEKKEPKLHK